jgi:hypothetical protein
MYLSILFWCLAGRILGRAKLSGLPCASRVIIRAPTCPREASSIPEYNLTQVENHLIELLPRKERLRLLAMSEPVQLVLAEVLCEHGQPMRHVYFPTDGFISLIAPIDGEPGLEVAMVGRASGPGCRDLAAACTGTRRWKRTAHRYSCFSRRASAQRSPSTRFEPVHLCVDGPVIGLGCLSAVSSNRPTTGTLASHEPGPVAFGELSCDP